MHVHLCVCVCVLVWTGTPSSVSLALLPLLSWTGSRLAISVHWISNYRRWMGNDNALTYTAVMKWSCAFIRALNMGENWLWRKKAPKVNGGCPLLTLPGRLNEPDESGHWPGPSVLCKTSWIRTRSGSPAVPNRDSAQLSTTYKLWEVSIVRSAIMKSNAQAGVCLVGFAHRHHCVLGVCAGVTVAVARLRARVSWNAGSGPSLTSAKRWFTDSALRVSRAHSACQSSHPGSPVKRASKQVCLSFSGVSGGHEDGQKHPLPWHVPFLLAWAVPGDHNMRRAA